MSIAIIKVSESYVPVIKKIMKAFNAKIRILSNEEEYEKKIMLQLIEESDNTEDVPEKIISNDFKKYGVNL